MRIHPGNSLQHGPSYKRFLESVPGVIQRQGTRAHELRTAGPYVREKHGPVRRRALGQQGRGGQATGAGRKNRRKCRQRPLAVEYVIMPPQTQERNTPRGYGRGLLRPAGIILDKSRVGPSTARHRALGGFTLTRLLAIPGARGAASPFAGAAAEGFFERLGRRCW